MATAVVTVSADVAMRMDTNLAAGAGPHLPVGNWSGAEYRSAMRFNKPTGWQSWVGPYAGSAITKATLSFYISDHAHVGVKNSSIYVRRTEIGDPWTKGAGSQDCGSGFTSGNNTQSGDVNAATTDQVSFSSGTTANAKKSVTVTAMVRTFWAYDQAPVFIFDNVGSDDYTELWADEKSGYNAELTIEYDDAVAPTAPTLTSPAEGATVDDTTPRLSWTHNHPQGNAQSQAEVALYTAAGVLITTYAVAGATAYYDIPVVLTRGVSYRWAVRTANTAVGFGPYSAQRTFTVRANPVITISAVRKMVYANGAPRLVVEWTSDQPQNAYQITAPGYDSGTLPGGTQSHTLSGLALTNNIAVTVTVIASSTYGGVGSDTQAFTPRWGLTTHRKDLGVAPLGWGTPQVTAVIPAGASMPVEYGSADTAAASPTGGWFSTLSSVPLRRYVYYRVWFIPNATESPVLDKVVIPVNNTVALIDKWGTGRPPTTLAAPWRIDQGEYVYGTRSVMCDVPGAGPYFVYSTDIEVREGRSYVLSGLMKTEGADAGATIRLHSAADGATLAQTEYVNEARDWYETGVLDTRRYKSDVWVAPADMTVYVVLRTGGTAGSKAWFDAIKLEESTVATPWSPGAVGATVVDAGGVQVDASRGGVLRYRGYLGGTRDVVEGGNSGLVFGGDTQLWSPGSDRLAINNNYVIQSNQQPYPNMLRNGGFRNGLTGWTFNQNGDANAAFGLWGPTDATWVLPDGDVSNWSPAGARGSTAVIQTTTLAGGPYESYIYSQHVPVFAGERYSVGAMLGVHRVRNTRVTIWWYDSAGTLVGSDNSPTLIGDGSAGMGGATRSGWNRLVIEDMVAPATANHCRVVIISGSPSYSGTSYLFIDQVQFNIGTRVGIFTNSRDDDMHVGIAMPTNPIVGDRIWRTDLQMAFVYTGSWVSEQRWPLHFVQTTPAGLTATMNNAAWLPLASPIAAGTVYLDRWDVGFQVAGGTALSASHKWDVVVEGYPDGSGSSAQLAGYTIGSGALGVSRRAQVAIGSQATHSVVRMNAIKTGTPGNLFVGATLWYRIINP